MNTNIVSINTGTIVLVLIILKLAHVINWAWWIVLLPVIISIGFFVLLGLALGVVWVINKSRK